MDAPSYLRSAKSTSDSIVEDEGVEVTPSAVRWRKLVVLASERANGEGGPPLFWSGPSRGIHVDEVTRSVEAASVERALNKDAGV